MSSKRTYDSGCKKRKAKELKIENLNLIRGSMKKFLRKTNISENEALTDQSSETAILDLLSENVLENNLHMQKDNVNENNIEMNSGSELSSTFKIINSLKENTVEASNMESNFENSKIQSHSSIESNEDFNNLGISDDFSLDLNCEFPTDRGKFPDIIKNSNLKRQIISFGPCKPNIKFPLSTTYFEDSKDSKSRKFSVEYYFTTNLSGQKIPRGWLCYSIILDKVYCESCWLFADRKHSYFKSNWINGIDDWQHLTLKINKHESSVQHIEAVKLRTIWTKNLTIDQSIEILISKEAQKWRDILTRLIKIILFLTAGNTALRGNERKLSETNPSEENFIRAVRLLAEFDPVLNSLLLTEQSRVKYLSWKIQNELIEILATNLQQLICEEIRSAQCFSIIIDSTQDITKIDQVSFIFRYTIVDYKESKLEIKESFLGFYPLDKHDAEGHVNLIKAVLNTHNLDISKCRGQGYDGASVMSGCFSGVQKRITDIIPNASFVHCAAHNLNLVLSDMAKSTPKISSAPRWATLALGDDVAKIA
ncbi:zinc finger MYM-type protein 1-like [Metopolophium dirhodum]|uniref:zinc finger MYM-type protein 1-like n=1 Tax=Metopolophium dirhodum TaxID=44670 RepID=UPI0029904AF8|nr:zinc finger MYM-type protein 1-like [Metopolophium dirhodum]